VPNTASDSADSLLYVSPASPTVLISTHILTNDAAPEMAEANVPVPTQCCSLCTGLTTQKLYSDVMRTTRESCPVFFLSYATGVGWICQYHSNNGTVASSYATASIAYYPA
jgi:hypothetical protein